MVNGYSQPCLTNGLVAYYPFNGNANDESGHGYNATVNGALLTTNQAGMANSAYAFDGINDYIQTPVPNGPEQTLSAWVYARTSGDVVYMESVFDSDVRSIGGIGWGLDNGRIKVLVNHHWWTPNVTFSMGEWMHVALTVAPTSAAIYLNGLWMESYSFGAYSTPICNYRIGCSCANPLFFDGLIATARIYNRALSASEVQQLYQCDSQPPACIPHAATASATVVSGFVNSTSISDGGCGYTNTPPVRIIGGGGSGAQAVAVVSNGVVVAVNILDAGNGYTSTPLVVIGPPFIPNIILGIAPMSFLSFSNVTIGGTYQLQYKASWYWSNLGLSFTASSSNYRQMVAGVVDSGDYRLALNPVPSQAFATAQVLNGFVVGATVTAGGSGYVTSPVVTIAGGGGSNATAVAHTSGGVVTSISISSAGIGYTNTPTVQIAPPPAAAVSPSVLPVMRVDAVGLLPYENYQILFKPNINGTWANWNGVFNTQDVTNSQFIFITNGTGFFRLQYVP
jgi:hypothetical protein